MNSIRFINRNLFLRSINSNLRFTKLQKSSTVQLNRQLKDKNDRNATIYITESAISRLKKILDGKEVFRISIDSGGCKGFNYLFKVDAGEINSEDKQFEFDHSKIVVDNESYEFLKNSILDFSDELIKSSFQIKSNPQNSESCSCGISFSPKIDL